ncbi:MAG: phosphoglycerate mutase family protein [Pirellulaceae bacterium]|nr:phosphoglycerate mutase family protein [Pirellulaceae bacterium]
MMNAMLTVGLILISMGHGVGVEEMAASQIQSPVKNQTSSQVLTLVLLRHAEKVDDSRDPELSKTGHERAQALAILMRDSAIQQIHTSDFKRTRDTVAPLAEKRGIEVVKYDPGKLQAFAERLQTENGVHLIVGHSNTTPKLVELLGGIPGKAIDEASEFDRLYIITIPEQGDVSTLVLRYGDPGP